MRCSIVHYAHLQRRSRILALVSRLVTSRLHFADGMARTKQSCRMSTGGRVRRTSPEHVVIDNDLTSGSDSESGKDREAKRSRPATNQAIGTSSPLQQVPPYTRAVQQTCASNSTSVHDVAGQAWQQERAVRPIRLRGERLQGCCVLLSLCVATQHP